MSTEAVLVAAAAEEKSKTPVFPAGRDPTPAELAQVPPQWAQYLGEVLFPAETIKALIVELAERVNKEMLSKLGPDDVVLVVPILKGAFVFASDLLRHFRFPYEIDFLNVSSYGDSTHTSGKVTLLSPLQTPVKNRHVLLVEDLVDTGLTLDWARKYILEKEPASLRLCVFLNKHGRRAPDLDIPIDFYAADCPNKFIVGYGMDFAQQYRCLPYIAVLKPEAYKNKKKKADAAEPGKN